MKNKVEYITDTPVRYVKSKNQYQVILEKNNEIEILGYFEDEDEAWQCFHDSLPIDVYCSETGKYLRTHEDYDDFLRSVK